MSDRLEVLGNVDLAEHRYEQGQARLETARTLHVAERRPREIAIDDQALAGIHRDQKRFAEALRALDACIAESREADDPVIEGYCHVSAGLVLVDVGYYPGAQEELELAERRLVLDRDRVDLEIAKGWLDLRNGFGPQRLTHLGSAVAEVASELQLEVVGADHRYRSTALVVASTRRSARDSTIGASWSASSARFDSCRSTTIAGSRRRASRSPDRR